MCVKNMNVNCLFCNETRNVKGVYSIESISDNVWCTKKEDEKYVTNRFSIVIFLTAIGSEHDSPFGKRFDLRLTLINRETKNGIKLVDYRYEPGKNIISANGLGQDKDYSSTRLILDAEPFDLDGGLGEYVLKVWLKDADSIDDWSLQTMQPINFAIEEIEK